MAFLNMRKPKHPMFIKIMIKIEIGENKKSDTLMYACIDSHYQRSVKLLTATNI